MCIGICLYCVSVRCGAVICRFLCMYRLSKQISPGTTKTISITIGQGRKADVCRPRTWIYYKNMDLKRERGQRLD